MTKTRLEGWTEEEYRQWAAKHPEEAETRETKRMGEARMNFDSGAPRMTGYAAVFNNETELWPGFKEQVAPGAFAKSIQQDDVRALFNHEPSLILARKNKEVDTLILREDSKGLYYEFIIPDTTAGRDLQTNVKLKNITQSSFGFNIVSQNLKYDKENDTVHRTLTEVMLFDVSPVTFPAYSSTEVHVRMTRNEGSAKDEVIEVTETKPVVQPTSDEDLFKEFESLKKKAF